MSTKELTAVRQLPLRPAPSLSPPVLRDVVPPEASPEADPAVTLLATHETPVNENPISPTPSWLHSHWAARRARVLAALHASEAPIRRLSAFANCGYGYWILQHAEDPHVFKAARDYCGDRWCELCQRNRAHVIRSNLERVVPDHPVRFITLTLRSATEGLRELLSRLYRGFRALRASDLWKAKTEGGVAFLEITRGKKGDHWHPHLHILAQGKYIDLQDLSDAWLAATGDSHHVDIRLVRNRQQLFHYVTKYCTKTSSPQMSDHPEALLEAIRVLRGQRAVVPFGTWLKFRLLRKDSAGVWKMYGHESKLDIMAYEGDILASALRIVLAAIRDGDVPGGDFEFHVQYGALRPP